MIEELGNFLTRLKLDLGTRTYGEMAVRQAIIEPMLRILGWTTHNLDEVTPEYPVKGGLVDYALRLNNSSKVFIEAKKGGEDLEKPEHQEQLLKYSFQEGVDLATLTNGGTWHFYLPREEGPWHERRFHTIDISEREVTEAADEFVKLLSKEKVRNGEAVTYAQEIYRRTRRKREIEKGLRQAWNEIVTEPDSRLVDLLSEVTEKRCRRRPAGDEVRDFLALHRDKFVLEASSAPAHPQRGKRSGRKLPKSGKVKIYDDLISDILDVLREKGGGATKKEVQEAIFARRGRIFQERGWCKKDSTGPIWVHRIASAKEEAKKRGLVKPPEQSRWGYWELTSGGLRKARSQ